MIVKVQKVNKVVLIDNKAKDRARANKVLVVKMKVKDQTAARVKVDKMGKVMVVLKVVVKVPKVVPAVVTVDARVISNSGLFLRFKKNWLVGA